MPLRLNVGLSKKIGLPDYGSLGASANLELELDSGAVSDPERLRQHVRHLFGLAKTSVEEELQQQQAIVPKADRSRNGREPPPQTNGHAPTNEHRPARRSNGRAATQSQVRAIHAIATRQRLNLAAHLERYRVSTVEQLGVQQASELIDDLNAEPAGAGGGR